MNYPFFALQTPVLALQIGIEKFINLTISNNYSGITTKSLFGVPISQVYNTAYITNKNLAGRDFGKIAVLVVDMFDYTPLCAILIESFSEPKISEGAENILNAAKLPWSKVNSRNMEGVVSDLLRISLGSSSSTNAKPPVAKTEWMIARKFRKLFSELPNEYRVMEQVALSEVIETLNLDNRNLHKPNNWNNPQNLSEFEALSGNSQYYKLNDFASRSSFDVLIINKNVITKSDEWWPVLAIEIDGQQHNEDERQKLNDSLKDRICHEALLPLLRVKLYESPYNLYVLAENEIKNMPTSNDSSIVFELITFLVFEGIKNGSLVEQNRRQEERRKLINKFRRIQVLKQQGLSIEESLEVFKSENSEQLNLDWLDEMSDIHVATEVRDFEIKKFESEYQAMYGKKPEIDVSVSNDGILTGHLGSLELPKVKCICTFFGEKNMEKYLLKFGEEWLIRKSLYSEKTVKA